MTDILARLRVRETHGIRRFLYPLTAEVLIPTELDANTVALLNNAGEAIVFQLRATDVNIEPMLYTLDFAPFLAPYAELELLLTQDRPRAAFGDLLNVTKSGRLGWKTQQQRFSLETDWDYVIDSVTYDGMEHLSGKSSVTRNDQEFSIGTQAMHNSELRMQAISHGMYYDGCHATTNLDVTACKSWATVTHIVQQPKAGDVITFALPLTVTALPLLCDFGVGGGVYGKIGMGDTVTWETKFTEEGPVQWTVSTNGRTDYAGSVPNRAEYHAQQWFHVIDREKALAVALVHVPETCRTLTVTMNGTGDVQIAFTLGEMDGIPAEFGVCFHFLNDAPAIAAATNPQSILLPPTVEVV